MAIPAYLWLKDDGGALIKGGVDVQDRECSIEVKGFHHNLMIPTDNATGKITGTRMHSPMLIIKESTGQAHTSIRLWQPVKVWYQLK